MGVIIVYANKAQDLHCLEIKLEIVTGITNNKKKKKQQKKTPHT